MFTIVSLRCFRMLLLLAISVLVAACSSSQSTVVEPKSEIGQPAVSGTTSSGVTSEAVFSVAEPKGTGVATQDQSSAGALGGQVPGADQQSAVPVSAPLPAENVTVPTVPVSADKVPLQNQPPVESPPQARKLVVDRQVIVDLGRASGKVVVQ